VLGALKNDIGRSVKSTYDGFVFKSEGLHERRKLLDVCEATGHLGDLEFTTGTDE